jgi:hypothetical protein
VIWDLLPQSACGERSQTARLEAEFAGAEIEVGVLAG